MEYQWLLTALIDPLAQASPTIETYSKFGDLTVLHIPGHYLYSPPMDH
jgi:hypothetical protein